MWEWQGPFLTTRFKHENNRKKSPKKISELFERRSYFFKYVILLRACVYYYVVHTCAPVQLLTLNEHLVFHRVCNFQSELWILSEELHEAHLRRSKHCDAIDCFLAEEVAQVEVFDL